MPALVGVGVVMTDSMPVRPVVRRMLRIRSLVLFMSGMFY